MDNTYISSKIKEMESKVNELEERLRKMEVETEVNADRISRIHNDLAEIKTDLKKMEKSIDNKIGIITKSVDGINKNVNKALWSFVSAIILAIIMFIIQTGLKSIGG